MLKLGANSYGEMEMTWLADSCEATLSPSP
jgi:hypothetical protein